MKCDNTFGERLADGVIHGLGLLACLIALPALIVFAGPHLPIVAMSALAIYAAASLAMFAFSAAYNMIPVAAWKDRLRRLDQAAIFMKIAGTYTPFAILKLGGVVGGGLLAAVWTVALSGAAAKLFLPKAWDRYTVVLYLALGWAVLFVIRPLSDVLPFDAVILLAVGGTLYTIGVIFHLCERLPYQNAIWHGFVLAAASCHYLAVLRAVTLA